MILRETYQVDSMENYAMAAKPSIEPARFLHDQPQSASPDLLRSLLTSFLDAPHRGLTEAIGATLPGASWHRCRTDYAANLMSVTPKTSWPWVKTLLHSVCDHADAASVHAQYDRLAGAVQDKLPQVAAHLDAARADVLPFTAFPGSCGGKYGLTSRRSASTGKSAGALTWSGSSPTATP